MDVGDSFHSDGKVDIIIKHPNDGEQFRKIECYKTPVEEQGRGRQMEKKVHNVISKEPREASREELLRKAGAKGDLDVREGLIENSIEHLRHISILIFDKLPFSISPRQITRAHKTQEEALLASFRQPLPIRSWRFLQSHAERRRYGR